jgi:hypothetical protein
MSIKEFVTEEKLVRGRIYKKNYAICICDFCLKEWKSKRWNKKNKHTFCSDRCNFESRKKGNLLDREIKILNKERYGFESPNLNDEIKNKKKKNNILKYGAENIQETSFWKEKRKKSIHEKYGDEFFKTDEFKEKRKISLIEKYGVDSPIKNKNILDKRKKTNIQKYGGEPLSNPKILEKCLQTNKEKYGYKTSFELEEIQEKCYIANHGYTREQFLERLGEYKIYRSEVRRITEKQDLTSLENYDKRGKETYHLDHIYSISEGFKNNIKPEIIASIINLRFIEAKINQQKTNKCDFCIEELTRRYDDLQQKNLSL